MALDPKIHTFEEVAVHNKTKDCWLIISVAEGARLCGATRIIGVDLNPSKFEAIYIYMTKIGVTEFVNSADCGNKPVSQVYDVTPFMDDHPGGDEVLLSVTGRPMIFHPINLIYLSFKRDLHNNKLTGPIPPQIGRLKRLRILHPSFNNFKGEIPKELAYLPELRYLYLHENRFIGRIPPELGTLQNLRHLDVGNNHLVGTIRELIHLEGSFPALRNLYLNDNYLTGGVPSQLAN